MNDPQLRPTRPRTSDERPKLEGDGGLVTPTDHGDTYTKDGPAVIPPFPPLPPIPIPGVEVPYGLREGGSTGDVENGSGGWYEGAGFLYNIRELERQLSKEETDGAVAAAHGAVAVVGTVGMVADPLGTILAGVAGWVIDHVEPLPTYLDWVAGDPDEITAFSSTWENIGNESKLLASDLRLHIANDTADMKSQAVRAYRGYGNDRAVAIHALGEGCALVSKLVAAAAGIVDTVRTIVRDLCAEAFAQVAKIVIKRFVPIPDVSGIHTIVARYAPKVSNWIRVMVHAVQAIRNILKAVPDAFTPIIITMNNALPNLPAIGAPATTALPNRI